MQPKLVFPLGHIVEVEWVDSCTHGRWDSIEAYRENADVITCRSSGYLLSRTARVLTLVQSQASNETISDAMSIPAKAVRRVRRLK